MKKYFLLLGLAGGLLLAVQAQAALSWTCRSGGCGTHRAPAAEQPVGTPTDDYEEVDPTAFYRQLNPKGKDLYDSMDAEGKQLALRLSKQYPNKNHAVHEAVKYQE